LTRNALGAAQLRRHTRLAPLGAASGRQLPGLVTTPHSGYHYDGSSRRFFEGWYWKVTADDGTSFALIYSVEDPAGGALQGGVGVQVMGPKDGDYLCQFNRDTSCFWADPHQLALGAALRPRTAMVPRAMTSHAEFTRLVEHGFQASATLQQGSIIANEAGAAGAPMSTVPDCSWDLSIRPVSGWGAQTSGGNQKATAGWLSVLSVFEPHWQVLMSHGLADGWVQWGGQRYEFKSAASYAEKNWGGGFPSKWHWIQCNTFDGQPGLSVTAVGARRALLLGADGLGLGEEDVGLIGVTCPGGEFIELVPWNSELEWDVDPWGRWWVKAVSDQYEAVVEAQCEKDAGTVLRAPTIAQGLAPFCKDTFNGRARLRVWRRTARGPGGGSGAGSRTNTPFIDAVTTSAALEVGGGPWWAAWSAKAAMKEPFKTLVQLPIDVGALGKLVPGPFKPPGL